MDAIDILGSVLGHRSSGSGRGADILRDILRDGAGRASRRPSAPRSSPPLRPRDIEGEAKSLEDLLNVANERSSTGSSAREPSRGQLPRGSGGSPPRADADEVVSQNERALILTRAMINAAKADGQLSRAEQQSILSRLDSSSREAADFLRDEFNKPLDVREFAYSVPIGMEQQVYTVSLMAIDLDTGQEAQYLTQLSQALRISPDVRERIHERLGAPSIY